MSEISWITKRKGYWLFKSGKVSKELETDKRIHFNVQGKTSNYSVIFDKKKNIYTCTCSYSSLKFKDCSHIISCRLFAGEKVWGKKATSAHTARSSLLIILLNLKLQQGHYHLHLHRVQLCLFVRNADLYYWN